MENPNLSFELCKPEHYPSLNALMELCFSDLKGGYAPEEEIETLSRLYPRGQIVCVLDGKVIGANLSRIVPFEAFSKPHTQEDCIDQSRFEFDAAIGDSVYGLDVFVHPDYQNLKVGKQIVELFVKNVFEDNFYCMMGICRVVNYPAHMHEMDCETYALKVKNKELYDPCLSFHVRNGMEYVNVSPGFCEDDISSAGYGVIMASYNPAYDPSKPAKKLMELELSGVLVA